MLFISIIIIAAVVFDAASLMFQITTVGHQLTAYPITYFGYGHYSLYSRLSLIDFYNPNIISGFTYISLTLQFPIDLHCPPTSLFAQNCPVMNSCIVKNRGFKLK